MRPPRVFLAFLFLLLVGGGIAMIEVGIYAYTLFTVVPVLIGAIASLITRPATGLGAVAVGGGVGLLASLSLLALGLEGAICVVMAAPLTTPLGMLGSWLVYKANSAEAATGSIVMFLLLPSASLTWDAKTVPPVFEVSSSIEIAAPPERVWKHVVTFSELPEPHEWYFRAGIAYPRRARIEGTGVGAVRYCEFSTGPFVEPIEVWDEPRLLRFAVTANPAPMNELSPYGHISPKHLHGYLVSKHGQFKLTPLPNGHTLLEGTTWYQHGLWPAEYWRWWSDAIIHRIHMRVLTHIRNLAEAARAAR